MFAYANETGTELLSLDLIPEPTSYSIAVCGAGIFPVRPVRTQSGSSATTGRQVAANFGNEPGHVYRLEEGAAAPDETCFLATPSLLARTALPAADLGGTTCDARLIADLARIAGRHVENCWPLALIAGGARFVAASFVAVDTSALAAVAVVEDSVLLFHALPGRYSGPGESIWRVDDGGVFDPTAIRLLFTARLPQGPVAAFLWAGAEGESEQLVVADSALRSRSVLATYRYRMPQ